MLSPSPLYGEETRLPALLPVLHFEKPVVGIGKDAFVLLKKISAEKKNPDALYTEEDFP